MTTIVHTSIIRDDRIMDIDRSTSIAKCSGSCLCSILTNLTTVHINCTTYHSQSTASTADSIRTFNGTLAKIDCSSLHNHSTQAMRSITFCVNGQIAHNCIAFNEEHSMCRESKFPIPSRA